MFNFLVAWRKGYLAFDDVVANFVNLTLLKKSVENTLPKLLDFF